MASWTGRLAPHIQVAELQEAASLVRKELDGSLVDLVSRKCSKVSRPPVWIILVYRDSISKVHSIVSVSIGGRSLRKSKKWALSFM